MRTEGWGWRIQVKGQRSKVRRCCASSKQEAESSRLKAESSKLKGQKDWGLRSRFRPLDYAAAGPPSLIATPWFIEKSTHGIRCKGKVIGLRYRVYGTGFRLTPSSFPSFRLWSNVFFQHNSLGLAQK
jgi:hypothetical protein